MLDDPYGQPADPPERRRPRGRSPPRISPTNERLALPPAGDARSDDHYPPNSIPASGWPASVLQGCQSAWITVRHWRDQLDQERNPSGSRSSIQNDLRFAQCIRQHGFPDFPDPAADGQTPVSPPPGFDKSNLSPAARAAIQACQGT